jgi:hypothetical protein
VFYKYCFASLVGVEISVTDTSTTQTQNMLVNTANEAYTSEVYILQAEGPIFARDIVFFSLFTWGGVRLSPLGMVRRPIFCLLYQHRMMRVE